MADQAATPKFDDLLFAVPRRVYRWARSRPRLVRAARILDWFFQPPQIVLVPLLVVAIGGGEILLLARLADFLVHRR